MTKNIHKKYKSRSKWITSSILEKTLDRAIADLEAGLANHKKLTMYFSFIDAPMGHAFWYDKYKNGHTDYSRKLLNDGISLFKNLREEFGGDHVLGSEDLS